MTTYTAAEIADIDDFIAELHKPDGKFAPTAEDLAKWDAEEARREAIAAAGRRVNEVVADYYRALDCGDTAGCRRADAEAWIARAELAAAIAS